ncbi:SUN domain-containing protein 2-like isoform X1 [Notolabrus celidotus]|uniref:SUN domain-containing protein 2-like isoform X1 n=1 Tax=Notolabrus celidotus TaxID=1203425 RepID=UPI00148FE07F|nr:SUN domain-containing protein 2-like isoform X1 [Notolabrus celidotus]
MSRRSSRLMSSGYYKVDENSDVSYMPNISYRENLTKVFKKRHYNGSDDPSRAESNAISELWNNADDQTVSPIGTVPALTRSSSQSQAQIADYSKLRHPLMFLADMLLSSKTKNACGLILLLVILVLSTTILFPLLTSVMSSINITKTPSQTKSPPPLPNPNIMPPTPMVDPAVVSAAVEEKMQHRIKELQLTQEQLILRIQALETQSAKLSQDASSTSVQDQLSPDLQQAKYRASTSDYGRPMADKMADFALETLGASVIYNRCSKTYFTDSACVTLFGFPMWHLSESPRTVIQGHPVLLPGKCWPFPGVQGTLGISLSHPIRITQVTLDHLPRYNSPTGRIDSAPKEFEVYGLKNKEEEGTLLGTFTYDKDGESTQTFKLPNPSDDVYRHVELRVLSNWGNDKHTCLYRFRVHGQIAST